MAYPLLLSLALLADPSPATTDDPPRARAAQPLDLDARRVMLFGTARAGARFVHGSASPGGSLQGGAAVRVVRGLFLEGEVGEGLYARPGHAVGTIAAGVRYELRRWDRVRPSAFLGFVHAHRSTLDDLADAPGATLAGFADTISHRTGMKLDLGLRLPFPARLGRPLSRLSGLLRADLAYYTDHKGWPLHVGVAAGISITL